MSARSAPARRARRALRRRRQAQPAARLFWLRRACATRMRQNHLSRGPLPIRVVHSWVCSIMNMGWAGTIASRATWCGSSSTALHGVAQQLRQALHGARAHCCARTAPGSAHGVGTCIKAYGHPDGGIMQAPKNT